MLFHIFGGLILDRITEAKDGYSFLCRKATCVLRLLVLPLDADYQKISQFNIAVRLILQIQKVFGACYFTKKYPHYFSVFSKYKIYERTVQKTAQL